MKKSTKRLLALAVCSAGLGLTSAAAAQQKAPTAAGQRSFAPWSLEQQQAQQAINNKIRRIPPVGLGDRYKRPPEQLAAELAAQRKSWEPTPPPADPRDFTGAWAMINGR